MPVLEIYWSFGSPYSYLAIDRLVAIEQHYDVAVDFRPVRPLALRESDFFTRGRKQFLPYLVKDAAREAERLAIPFGFAFPHPVVIDFETGEVASEQPMMNTIMGLAFAAINSGRGLEFAQAIGRSVWGGKIDWFQPEIMTQTLSGARFDLAELSAWVADNQNSIAHTLARNEKEQLEHHWGVPLMILDDEPFFGQDRLEALFWRLEQLDLRYQ